MSGNAFLFPCFHCPKRSCIQSMKFYACPTFPANNALKKRGSSRGTVFLTKHPPEPKQLFGFTSWWLLLCQSNAFSRDFFCEGWILLKNNMCNLQCVLCSKILKCSIPHLFLCHDNTRSGRCCLLQRLNTYLKVAIVFKQFGLNNRNNSASKCTLYPLKMQHSSQRGSPGLYA